MREAVVAARAGGSLKALAARDARERLRAHLRQLDEQDASDAADGAATAAWRQAAPPGLPLDAAMAELRMLAQELAALPM